VADILRGIVAVVVDIVVDTVDAFVGGGGSARYGGRHPDLLLLRCACCCCAEIQLPPVSRKLVGEVIRVIHGLLAQAPSRGSNRCQLQSQSNVSAVVLIYSLLRLRSTQSSLALELQIASSSKQRRQTWQPYVILNQDSNSTTTSGNNPRETC